MKKYEDILLKFLYYLVASSIVGLLLYYIFIHFYKNLKIPLTLSIAISITLIVSLLITFRALINFNQKVETINLKIPEQLRTSFQQYILFFNEYLYITKEINYSINIIETEEGIGIELPKSKNIDSKEILVWFNEYLDYIKSNLPVSETKYENNITRIDKEFFEMRFENQIQNLKRDFQILNRQYKMLEEQNTFLKNLSLNLSGQQHNPIIHNHLNIEGPKISIDKIINESSVLNETDKAFIDLIHQNTSSEEERKELIKSLEDVKSEDTTTEEKQKSGSLLKKFLETGVSEASKTLVREIIETGGEYLDVINTSL